MATNFHSTFIHSTTLYSASSTCFTCEAGKFGSAPGGVNASLACQYCPGGTYSLARGCTACVSCGPGLYSGLYAIPTALGACLLSTHCSLLGLHSGLCSLLTTHIHYSHALVTGLYSLLTTHTR